MYIYIDLKSPKYINLDTDLIYTSSKNITDRLYSLNGIYSIYQDRLIKAKISIDSNTIKRTIDYSNDIDNYSNDIDNYSNDIDNYNDNIDIYIDTNPNIEWIDDIEYQISVPFIKKTITTTKYKCKIKDIILVIEKTDNSTTNFWFQYLNDRIDDKLLKELCSLLIKLNFYK